jgi:hypothetical protein
LENTGISNAKKDCGATSQRRRNQAIQAKPGSLAAGGRVEKTFSGMFRLNTGTPGATLREGIQQAFVARDAHDGFAASHPLRRILQRALAADAFHDLFGGLVFFFRNGFDSHDGSFLQMAAATTAWKINSTFVPSSVRLCAYSEYTLISV